MATMMEVSIATIRQVPNEALIELRDTLKHLDTYPSFQKWFMEWIEAEMDSRCDNSIEPSMMTIPRLSGDELGEWLRAFCVLQRHKDKADKLIDAMLERVVVQASVRLQGKD